MKIALAALAVAVLACGVPPSSERQCGSCHMSATAAWGDSAHANTNSSALFAALLPRVEARWGQQERARCESCHAPVTCASCHLAVGNNGEQNRALVIDEDAAVATSTTPTGRAPHRAVRRPFFRSASLCGTCHEVRTPHLVEPTLTEYRASGQASDDSCATCHLEGHRLSGASAKTLAQALRLDVSASEVRLTNVGAAHSVPTGQVALREVWVDVTVLDQNGTTLEFPRALELSADLGGAEVFTDADAVVSRSLAAGETRVFRTDGARHVTARLFFRAVRESTTRALQLAPAPVELVSEVVSP